jgi:hypothetical protein
MDGSERNIRSGGSDRTVRNHIGPLELPRRSKRSKTVPASVILDEWRVKVSSSPRRENTHPILSRLAASTDLSPDTVKIYCRSLYVAIAVFLICLYLLHRWSSFL